MTNGEAKRIILTGMEILGIAGLAGIALWRNHACYKAECKLIETQRLLRIEEFGCKLQKMLIDSYKKEINNLKERVSELEHEEES